MKAERRHDLEKNELDNILSQVLQFLRENWTMLAVGVAAVVLGFITYKLLTHETPITSPAAPGWQQFFLALSDRDAESELEAFLDKSENKNSTRPPVIWAKLLLGERKVAEGARRLFEDRELATESLAEAEKYLSDVEKHAGNDQQMLDRARIGLAKIYESQNKPDDAVKQYDLVLRASPESAQGKMAARGKTRLSSSSNREFLAWFAEQKPFKRPPPGSPPASPLPEGPDFTIPGLDSPIQPITPGLKLPGDQATTPPSETVPPSEEETPPAEEQTDPDEENNPPE